MHFICFVYIHIKYFIFVFYLYYIWIWEDRTEVQWLYSNAERGSEIKFKICTFQVMTWPVCVCVCFRDVTLSSQPSAANCSSGELNSTSRSTESFICGAELKTFTGISISANTEVHVFHNNTHYTQHPAWPRTNRKWPVTRLSVDVVFCVVMCIYLAVGGMTKIFRYSMSCMINCKHFTRNTAI